MLAAVVLILFRNRISMSDREEVDTRTRMRIQRLEGPACGLVGRLQTTVHRPKSQIAVYSKLQFEGFSDLNHNRW